MSLPEPTPKPLLKFPPFPPVPEGTTILPFASYKETGIQIAPSHSGEEVDGLRIPTVELRVPHDTDECKTGATKRSGSIKNLKKVEEEVVPVADPNPNPKRTYYHYERRDWWEEWAEAEESRGSSNAYNPNVSRMDRIHQAATDFRMNRRWPHVKSQVPYLWDQIRLYVGLLGVTPVWHRTDLASSPTAAAQTPQENTSESDDDYSDTDTRNVYQAQQDEPQRRPFKRFHVRPPYALYGATPVQVDSDAAVQRLLEDEKGRKEERLLSFLNNPENSVKVFLSSYMRSQGLIWSAPALNTLPRLFVFFLTFLLRNRVLPEPTHERALNKALTVAKLALEELPKTGRICKVLPDKLGLSCVEKFGARRWALDEKKIEKDDDVENTDLVEQFEAELKAANVEVLKVDDIVPSVPSLAVLPTPLPLPAKPTTTHETPNWAALAAADRNPTPSSTTTHTASTPNWADAPDDDDDAHVNNNPFQGSAKLEQWAIPAVQIDPEIMRYRCGVAERSVRRVKDMKPVPGAKLNSNLTEGPRSANHGGELTTRYAKVVLAPWNKGEWDDGGQAPAFRKASVIPPPPSPSNDEEQQHKTEEGDITLLVETHVLRSLSVGMGLAGTWVQLVPLSGGKGMSRKGKGGGGERFWYVEELAMGVPSFWTVAQEEGEGVEGVCEDAYADF